MEKTNVMRLLTQKNVPFTPHEYNSELTDGESIASVLNEDPMCVFKTLVTVANTGEHIVFVVPVCANLDLKKAASAAQVKNVLMIKQKELLPLTGYIHGGCSPFGMKKTFRTFVEESATLSETIFVSAGKVGYQVELSPNAIIDHVPAQFADLV